MTFVPWPSLALAATLGVGSTLHCIGMCGGFSLMLTARGGHAWRRLLRFHLGRVATYSFLGSLAGSAGQRAAQSESAQRALALLAGGVMLALALHQFGVISRLVPARLAEVFRRATHRAAAGVRALAHGDGAVAQLLFGAANGLLPCGVTAAALGLAAASGSGLAGAAAMATFGAATLPALLLFARLGGRLALPWRARIGWLGALVTLLVGGITMWRGLQPVSNCCSHG